MSSVLVKGVAEVLPGLAPIITYKYSEKFNVTFLMDSELSTRFLTIEVSTEPPAKRK